MLIPYNVDVPMERWPIANWVLIGVTIVASFVLLGSDELLVNAAVWSEGFSISQLGTYLFAHADIFHLAGNMLFLFVFGNAVNAKLGHVLYLVLYVLAGVLAALAWLATDEGYLIGASGAIMGVVGAFLVFYPRNDISVAYWFGFIAAGTFSISSYWIILMYIAFDLVGVLQQGDGVAYISHLIGAAAGFGGASLMLAAKLVSPTATEQTIFQAVRGHGRRKEQTAARRSTSAANVYRPPPSTRVVHDDAPIPLVGDEPAPAPRTVASAKPVPKPTRPPGSQPSRRSV